MIKLCDRTLSCLDDFSPTQEQLMKLITLLFQCDVDYLEISEKIYRLLGSLPPFGSYVLRIDTPEKADQYPEFDRFVCEKKCDENRHVFAEIFVNDVMDRSAIMRHGQDKLLRISGLSSLFRTSVESSLKQLKQYIPKKVEFSPIDTFGCAVGAAVEWISADCGNTIVTSLGGIGGFAPFEQVLIALRQMFRRHPQTEYDALPRMRKLLAEITKQKCGICDPITGEGIFTVESGIHVSGILCHPKCYEPFTPESVGGTRKFTYGKFSGGASVKYKLNELGIVATEEEIKCITLRIKQKSEEENKSFSDDELRKLIHGVMSGGGKDERT